MSQNPDQRDKAIARLAAEALSSGGSAAGASCPNAEVLAAYAERGLEANEAAYWERHFSGCGRCRKTLALLAVSAEALAQQETQPRSQRADVNPLPLTAKPKQPVARPRHSPLRWLVPALGVAAAVALWFALRPLHPTTQTVAELQKVVPSPAPRPAPAAAPAAPATNSPATNSQATNSPAADSEVAQAELPSPPPAAPASSAKQIEPLRDLNELKKDNQESAAPAASSAAPAEAGQAQPRAEAFSAAAPPAAPPIAPAPSSATEEKAKDRLSAPASAFARNERTSPPGAPSANAAPSNPSSGQPAAQAQSTGSGRPSAAGQLMHGVYIPAFPSAAESIPTVVYSPGQSVAWRLGPAGRIERSVDQGRSWQPQTSGVTADILAGAAVSSQVAWIAGRGGVILRTTDGATWQRITPPMGLTLDWTRVEASDAQHATLASADLRRFSTADGGRTWTPQ